MFPFRMLITALTWIGRCCPNDDVENADGNINGNGKEEYRKLMTKLIRRYIDNRDEFADMDEAFRIQFERLTKEVRELKTNMKA